MKKILVVVTTAFTLVGLAWLATPATAAVASAIIKEFPIPTAFSDPRGITAGPDGNLWFVEESANKIGKTTINGVTTEFAIPANSCPEDITTGPDKRLWFTEACTGKIGALTTGGSLTEYSMPNSSPPAAITRGPDGKLWFTTGPYGPYANSVGNITITGTITEYQTGASNPATDIAVGPDRKLWFTDPIGDRIGSVTTAGIVTWYTVPTNSSDPIGITRGPDGRLWFTELQANKIGAITTAGAISEYTLPTGGTPNFITTGPDGNLWFTEYVGNKIGRITTDGSVAEYAVPTSNSSPYGIALGPDRNIWFTEESGNQIGQVAIAPPRCPVISGLYHCHVQAEDTWSTPTINGMGALFTEPDIMPDVKSGDYSIGQLALASLTSIYDKAIEFGWIVDPGDFGDHYPHLFIFLRFVGPAGGTGCFAGLAGQYPATANFPLCAGNPYQQLSSTYHPGMAVGQPLGHGNATPIMYHVSFSNHAWQIQYDNVLMGTVQESYWSIGGFAKGNTADWFGEVAYAGTDYCTATMGDGVYGSVSGAATITNMFYEKPNTGSSPANAHLNVNVDTPNKSAQAINARYWDSNMLPGQTFNSFSYGGPVGGPNPC